MNPIKTLLGAAAALNVFALTTSLTLWQMTEKPLVELPAIQPLSESAQYLPVELPKKSTKKSKKAKQAPKAETAVLKIAKPSVSVAASLPKTEETVAPALTTPTTQTASPSSSVLANASDFAKQWGSKMAHEKRYFPGKGVTYCNIFAADLANRILGADSPFLWEKWTAWLVANGRSGRAHDMYLYCMEHLNKGQYFEEISGENRFVEAWKAINEGKLVIFASGQIKRKSGRVAPGHFAIGVPTDPSDMRSAKDSNHKEYMVGRVVQAGASMLDGSKKLNGSGGHSYLSAAWNSDEFFNIRILVCKGTGRS